jgi:hypothetical protein
MGIVGLSEILVSSAPNQQCDMWTDRHGEIQMFISFHCKPFEKGTVCQTSAKSKIIVM